MPRSQTPTARRFMNPDVHTVSPETTMEELVADLLRRQLSNAPVVRGKPPHHELIGFVSEGDCLQVLSSEAFFSGPQLTVRQIMKRNPICVSPETDIFTLASIFTQQRFRHLPVVDGKELVGIVSRRDVLRALADLHQQAYETAVREKFPPDPHEIANHRFILG